MDKIRIREKSFEIVTQIGYPISRALPLLDETNFLRTRDELCDRALILHVLIACSYGYDQKRGLQLLKDEKLLQYLTEKETSFLESEKFEKSDLLQVRNQVESLFAFLWCLKLAKSIDPEATIPNDIVFLLPNLKKEEPFINFRKKTQLRVKEEIYMELDLYYCLHWAIRELQTNKKHPIPGAIKPHVIVQRRKALEWVVSPEDWDNIILDT